jgi:hypothetical protein
MSWTSTTDTQRFAATLEQLGVDLHPDIAKVMALRTAALASATAQPTEDLRAAMLAGELDIDNIGERVTQAATALLVRDKARRVLNDLDRPLARLTAIAVANNGDAIVEALRPTVDQALAATRDAVHLLGADPNHSVILNAGPGAAAAYAAHQEARRVLDLVRKARRSMQEAGYGPDETPAWWVERLRDDTDLENARQAWHRARWAGLIEAGYTVRLNTATEAEAVTHAVTSTTTTRLAAQREAQQAAARAAGEAELAYQFPGLHNDQASTAGHQPDPTKRTPKAGVR